MWPLCKRLIVETRSAGVVFEREIETVKKRQVIAVAHGRHQDF